MAILLMRELATTEVPRSDALHSSQVTRQPASTHDRPSESDRVGAGARVLRVLVVNAEQDSANALVRQVTYGGHAAHAAWDGFAALRVAAAWHPDVVLLDMEKLLMDGCQVAKQLRSDYLSEDCLIIAFAERADDACRKQCTEAGIDVLLNKPVDRKVVGTLLLLECVRVNRRRAPETLNNLKTINQEVRHVGLIKEESGDGGRRRRGRLSGLAKSHGARGEQRQGEVGI